MYQWDFTPVLANAGLLAQGLVNTLKVTGTALALGVPLGLGLALLAYVAQSFPEARLAPADAHGFARLQEFHSYLASTVHIAHAHRMRGYRWADDEAALQACGSFADYSPDLADAVLLQSIGGGGGSGTLARRWLHVVLRNRGHAGHQLLSLQAPAL